MAGALQRLFGSWRSQQKKRPTEQQRQVILTDSVITAIIMCLHSDTERRHEGIVYLFGRTDGTTTLIITAFEPQATTTRGSFKVGIAGMSQVLEAADRTRLHVVGQLHTHPGTAYHSDGDEEGAGIRFKGYVSIVVPEYGRSLPSLKGAACFMFAPDRGFVSLELADITVAPARAA